MSGTWKGHTVTKGPRNGFSYKVKNKKRYVPKKKKGQVSWGGRKSTEHLAKTKWQTKAYSKYLRKLQTLDKKDAKQNINTYIKRVESLSSVSEAVKKAFRNLARKKYQLYK